MPVVLDLIEPPPVVFGNDLHVKASVVIWEGTNLLTVPSTAVFRNGAAWAVFVVRDARAKLTPVTVGKTDGTRTVVERGLTDGDVVITQPATLLPMGRAYRLCRGLGISRRHR